MKYTENKLLIILIFIIILLSNSGFSYPLIRIDLKNPEINYNFNNLKPGDIIFFHDSGFDDSKWNYFYWTHCIMYKGSNMYIWAWDKIREDNFSNILIYFNVSNWAHLRVNQNFNTSDVIRFAEECIGQPFDMISLYLMTKQVDPPFWHFGYGYYCTELIWASYMVGANIDLDPDHVGWITLLEIYNSNYIDKIYVEDPNRVPKL